jgi:hypothetical protein
MIRSPLLVNAKIAELGNAVISVRWWPARQFSRRVYQIGNQLLLIVTLEIRVHSGCSFCGASGASRQPWVVRASGGAIHKRL